MGEYSSIFNKLRQGKVRSVKLKRHLPYGSHNFNFAFHELNAGQEQKLMLG